MITAPALTPETRVRICKAALAEVGLAHLPVYWDPTADGTGSVVVPHDDTHTRYVWQALQLAHPELQVSFEDWL